MWPGEAGGLGPGHCGWLVVPDGARNGHDTGFNYLI